MADQKVRRKGVLMVPQSAAWKAPLRVQLWADEMAHLKVIQKVSYLAVQKVHWRVVQTVHTLAVQRACRWAVVMGVQWDY